MIIEKLTKGKEIELVSEFNGGENSSTCMNSLVKVVVSVDDLKNKDEELQRLNSELKTVESEIARAERMLSNQGFIAKAPQKLIDEEKEKLDKYNKLKENLIEAISKLK